MRNVEILAPAGSAGALQAAVRCGAAAVYLGTDSFNARQHAENFAGDALDSAVAYCHVRGVQVHLTLNTLVRENELEQAIAVAKRAQAAGVDALIVQDVGLARVLHAVLPDMPLHASTQLSCHTPDGVRFLRDNGFSRVVLSREMSLSEIKACANLGCELEVFVHGALCMCVSGQCYFSAALGGRSGNRGLCAQPCRLPFSAQGTDDLTNGYALSLKDQSIVEHISDLAGAGVVSFKIEGRMKRPEYVAAAVTACRAVVEGKPVPVQLKEDLEAVFSRSGFTDGYYTAKRGTTMFGVRRQEDIAAVSVLKRLQNLYEKEPQTVAVDMHLTAQVGQPTVLTVMDADGNVVEVCGEPAQQARTVATTPEKAIAQLTKTGGTPFAVTAAVSIGENVMLPASQLNALRREALEKLENCRAAVPPRRVCDIALENPLKAAFPYTRLLRLQTAEQYSDALMDETVILPLFTPTNTLQSIIALHRGAWGVEIPRGLFEGTARVETALQNARAAGAAFVLCHTVNGMECALKSGLSIVGGFGMNCMNSETAAFYAQNGVFAMVVSPELSFTQMRFTQTAACTCGVLTYGRLPLMLTRNCPAKAAGQRCDECKGYALLTDRKRAQFPVMCTNRCSELLNSVPLYWLDKPAQLPADTFQLLHFTVESAKEVAAVLQQSICAASATQPITRGMYKKGVE